MSEDTEHDIDLVSKSQRKREADAMQALGQKLTELRTAQLALLPITDTLLSAIEEYNRLPNSYPARNRQLQFIGRVMRDSNYAEIADELARLESPNYVSAKTKRKRVIEESVKKLLTTGDSVINELLDKYPSLDRQQLRQLHREYQRCTETKQATLFARCTELLSIAIAESQT